MKSIRKILVLFLFAILFFSITQAQNKNYVIMISFDGFRWDYTNRGLTPNLDFIKENGVHALSLKPCFPTKTFPNHYSIVTGLYPENHGIIANNFIDPITNEIYKISDTSAVRNPKWYKGEAIWETAKRQGIKTASYFWPGSEVNLKYRRPDYYEKYEHLRDYDKRIEGVLDWLKLPINQRPKFITLYFDAADTYGHKYGTNSTELNNILMRLDSLVGKLFTGLKKINLYDSTNIIIVSDHGMTDVSNDRIINIEEILEGYNPKLWDYGPVMYVFPDENNAEKIYNKLKSEENNFKVYRKEEVPEYYHFSKSYLIPEIILVAEPGWSLITNKELNSYGNLNSRGQHGYDINYIDMHGIFFAIGPDFKTAYTCGTINNIDICPLLAELLGIYANQKIDGKLDNIKFTLKKY
jgi:predicted AlkP superfamily pyrophosphatase or phosphodiesterase